MPQNCQIIGVNSVTNIEPPKGFMPVLICVFADWLEKFPAAAAKLGNLRPGQRGI